MTDKAQTSEIQNASDFYVNLMVLKKAEANNEIDPFFREMGKSLGATHAFKPPYAIVSSAFTQQGVAASQAAYGDYWEKIHGEVKTSQIKDKLVNEAGYSVEEVAQIPTEVLQHFAVVDKFEEQFPSAESQKHPLIDRLRDGKDQLFDALGSEAGRKTLAAVSLGISVATGGIVTRLGIKAGAAVASKIVQNEAVQEFAGKLQDRAASYLEKIGVPTEKIASKFDGMKQSLKGVIDSPAFQRYGKPSLALAGIAVGALMLGSVDHDKLLELANSGFAKGADLASQGMDLAGQAVDQAKDFVEAVDWKATAAHAINDLGDAITGLGEHAMEFAANPIDTTVRDISDAAISIRDFVEGSGEMVAGVFQDAGEIQDRAQEFMAQANHAPYTGGDHEVYASAVDDQVVQVEASPAPAAAYSPDAIVAAQPAAAGAADVYHIEKGDSLWSIARDQFEAQGVTPTNGQIQEATKALYEANREVIGANPNLILAGHSINIDPAIFGAHHDVVSAAAPVAQAAPTPIHEQVKHLGTGLPANDSGEGFKSAIARVTSRMREVSESTPGM